MTNSINFIRGLAERIGDIAGVYTLSDFDIATIAGTKNAALVLHVDNIKEVVPSNNTQRLQIVASIVIAPETLNAAEESELQTSVYDKISTFLSGEELRYTEIGGAVFLQYLPGQYTLSLDGMKSNFDMVFEVVAQF